MNVVDVDTASYVTSSASVVRYELFVDARFPVSEQAVIETCSRIVEEFKLDNPANAIAVYISDLDSHYWGYTIARCDYAPNGVWSEAETVPTGDYSRHAFKYDFRPKVHDAEAALSDLPTDQEILICNEWMVAAEDADEAGYDPVKESEGIATQNIAEKFGIDQATVDEIVLKCVFWATR